MSDIKETLVAMGILAGGTALLGFAGWQLMHAWCRMIVEAMA